MLKSKVINDLFQRAVLSLGPWWGEVGIFELPNLYQPRDTVVQTTGIIITIAIGTILSLMLERIPCEHHWIVFYRND